MRLAQLLALAAAIFGALALAACSDSSDDGVRRWSDVIRAVDADDDRTIDDAFLVHIAPSGERVAVPLGSAVRDLRLEDGSLLAVDRPEHQPRFFRARDVDLGAGEPVRVALCACTRIVLESCDDWTPDAGPYVVLLRALGDTTGARFEWSPDNEFDAAADLLRLAAADESTEERRTILARVQRDRGHSKFIGLADQPRVMPLRGETTLHVEHLPYVVEDVPRGFEFELELLAPEGTTAYFLPEGGEDPSNVRRIRGDGPTHHELLVHAAGGSRIRARLPRDATDGTWRLVNGRERTNGAFEADGSLLVATTGSDECAFTAEWTDADGALAFVQRHFAAPNQGVHDLGELSVAGGFELRVVPTVHVDGEWDPVIEAALAERCDWHVRLLLPGADDFSHALDRLVPVTIRGGADAVAHVRGSLRDLEADDAFAFTSRGFDSVRGLALDDVHDVVLTLELERRRVVEFTSTVLPSRDGSRRELLGVLTNDEGGSAPVVFEPRFDPDPTQPWTVRGRASVRRAGTWRLDVAACPRIEPTDWAGSDFEAPLTFSASRTVTFTDEFRLHFALDLAAASAVVVTPGDLMRDDVSDGATFHPLGASPDIATIHHDYSFFAPNLAVGLLPGVEYVSASDPDLRFVAPPAGETLHLEPRSR
jgi:hypothetical protein